MLVGKADEDGGVAASSEEDLEELQCIVRLTCAVEYVES